MATVWDRDTLPWFPGVRRTARANDAQIRAAEALLRVVGPADRESQARLAQPDAWVHPCTQHLVFREPGIDAYVPLCPGDSVHFSHIQRVPFLYHDMVYVGGGCVVGLDRADKTRITKGVVVLERLDAVRRTGPRLCFNMHPRTCSRRDRVVRALLSIGYYPYSIARFNCQHAFHLISQDGLACPGHTDLAAVAATALACLLLVVLLCTLVRMHDAHAEALALARPRRRWVAPRRLQSRSGTGDGTTSRSSAEGRR